MTPDIRSPGVSSETVCSVGVSSVPFDASWSARTMSPSPVTAAPSGTIAISAPRVKTTTSSGIRRFIDSALDAGG